MAKTISTFLVSLFMAYMVTPTAVALLDSGFDYSYIYSIVDEEQNGEERKFGEKPTKLLSKFFSFTPNLSIILTKNIPDFHLNDWNTVYFELHSPPPEQV